jgi:hypothetical protein
MKEIKEYQRQASFNPKGDGGNAKGTFDRLASLEDSKPIGNTALDNAAITLAQNAANKRAELSGIEAAQKSPGKFLLPGAGEAGKFFADAYRKEEAQNLEFQVNAFLNEANTQFMKLPNPSNKDLQDYKNKTLQSVEKIISLSSEENRTALERAALSSFQSSYNQLTLKVEENNRRQAHQRMVAATSQGVKNIQNFNLSGEHDKAKEEYKRVVGILDNAVSLGQIGVDFATKQKEEARILLDSSYQSRLYEKAIKENKGDEFLKELREKPLNHLTPLQKEEVIAGVMQYGDRYQAALNGSQYIAFVEGETESINGTLTPEKLEDYKNKMGSRYFAQFQRNLAKKQAKENEKLRLYNKVANNLSDPTVLSELSNDEMNEVFEVVKANAVQNVSQKTGQDYKLSLSDEVVLAKQINRDIPSVTKKLISAVNFGDPMQAAEAAQSIRVLSQANHPIYKSIDTDTKATVSLFDALMISSSIDPQEALKQARDRVNIFDENKREEAKEKLKSFYSLKNLNDYKSKEKHVIEGIGAREGFIFKSNMIVPSGITKRYDKLMQMYIEKIGDPIIAEKLVFEQMEKDYQQTKINNRSEVMAYSPEAVYPAFKNTNFLQNDKVRAVKELVEINEKIREEGNFVFNTLEWKDAPYDVEVLNKKVIDGDLKIKINGVERKIVIDSDQITRLPPNGVPSWQINYIDDNGIQVPLLDGMGQIARWTPDVNRFNKIVTKARDEYDEKQLQKAKKYKEVYERDLTDVEAIYPEKAD